MMERQLISIREDKVNASYYVTADGVDVHRTPDLAVAYRIAKNLVQEQCGQKEDAQEKINTAKLSVEIAEGVREYPVKVLDERGTDLEIQMLSDGILPTGHAYTGEIVKVPRCAVTGFEPSEEIEEQEQGLEL